MTSTSSEQLVRAAMGLARELGAPDGDVSIGTRRGEDGVQLEVSLSPNVAYLMTRVPKFWRGMRVRCQVADRVTAH